MAKFEVRVWVAGTKVETHYVETKRIAREIQTALASEYGTAAKVTIAKYAPGW